MSGVNFSSIGGQLSKNTDTASTSLTNRMSNNFEQFQSDTYDGRDAPDEQLVAGGQFGVICGEDDR